MVHVLFANSEKRQDLQSMFVERALLNLGHCTHLFIRSSLSLHLFLSFFPLVKLASG